MRQPVAVIGAGSWGSALAMVLARGGRHVRLYARSDEKAMQMQAARENTTYLPGICFPETLQVSADLDWVLKDAEAVVMALPCSASESMLPRLATAEVPVIAACKGINPHTLERVDELFLRHLGEQRACLLSGPSFAREVACGQPTAITLAAKDAGLAAQAAALFDDSSFRIYTSHDMAGVALGGALKNVIAIAAGIAEGLHLGHNAAAALITRGIVEMTRLAMRFGGQQETLSGLSGLGDLVLTCTGELSRNRQFGMAMAQGASADEATARVGQVVEGRRTTAAAWQMARDVGVEMPITGAVYAVLHEQLSPQEAVSSLLSRPAGQESLR